MGVKMKMFLFYLLFSSVTFTSLLIGVGMPLDGSNRSDTEQLPQSPWTEGWFPYDGRKTQITFTIKNDHFSFQGNLRASGECSYPEFQNDKFFFQQINRKLREKGKGMVCEFISEIAKLEESEEEFDEETRDVDFDKREFRYRLTPVYASDMLVSVFGASDYYAGLPHGSSSYSGFNYWCDGKETHELTLESLFDPTKEFGSILSEYCLTTLTEDKIGYLYPDPEGNIPVKIEFEDLGAFTLSENGITITFQPYHVGGWADGPYSVIIPFQKLIHLIRADGPLGEFTQK